MKTKKRVEKGRLNRDDKIFESIGRIKECYPRVARYYEIAYNKAGLSWTLRGEKKAVAEKLDGIYLLKTDRADSQRRRGLAHLLPFNPGRERLSRHEKLPYREAYIPPA
ncbi:MAG: hypothetical protein H5U02_10405 [Clostridia bacterium]|nr:hypothetical protein [Clostridia bacterium]